MIAEGRLRPWSRQSGLVQELSTQAGIVASAARAVAVEKRFEILAGNMLLCYMQVNR